jgi:nucleoside 2-deoxyribosyltransferase
MFCGPEQNMYRVYFARAIDGIDVAEIHHLTEEMAREMETRGMQMVDPFVEISLNEQIPFEEKARQIVEGDLTLLKDVDAVFMDFSIPNRSYIGCICELVYAYLWKIPVVVYVGTSGNDQRYWLQYHASHVSKDRGAALDFLASFLNGQIS